MRPAEPLRVIAFNPQKRQKRNEHPALVGLIADARRLLQRDPGYLHQLHRFMLMQMGENPDTADRLYRRS